MECLADVAIQGVSERSYDDITYISKRSAKPLALHRGLLRGAGRLVKIK